MSNVDLKKYAENVATIVIRRYTGRLPQKDMRKFCETIMEIAESLDNYKTSPEDVIELIDSHVMIARIELQDIYKLSLHHLVSDLASDNWNNKKYYIERIQEICKVKCAESPELNMKMTIGEIRDIYKKLREK